MTFEKSFINSTRKPEGNDYRLKIVKFSSRCLCLPGWLLMALCKWPSLFSPQSTTVGRDPASLQSWWGGLSLCTFLDDGSPVTLIPEVSYLS